MIYFDVNFNDPMSKSVLLLYSEDGKVLGGFASTPEGAIGTMDLKSDPSLTLAHDQSFPLFLTLQYEIEHNRLFVVNGTISETKLNMHSILLKPLGFNPGDSI